MVETTTTTATTQVEFVPAAAERVAWWTSLTVQQQSVIVADYSQSGLPISEYVDALSGFASYAEFVAAAEIEEPVVESEPAAAEPSADVAETTEPIAEATEPAQAEPTVTEQADAAAAVREAELERLRGEAKALLADAGKAFRKGEAEYRRWLMEAGLLSHEDVLRRLAQEHPRDNAIKALVGELAESASFPVDAGYVNRLIAVSQAWRLLAKETGLVGTAKKPGGADKVPYGTYANAWCLLVQRVNKDTPQEAWALLPGLEEECKSLFGEGIAKARPRETATNKARGLVAKLAAMQKAEADKAAAQAVAEVEKAKQERTDSRAELDRLEAEKKALEEQAKREQDAEARKRMTEQIVALREEERKRREHDANLAREEEARKERERKEREQREAAERERKAADKAAGKKGKPGAGKTAEATSASEQPAADSTKPAADKPQRERATSADNLLKARGDAAMVSTAKDWAEMLAASLLEHPEPEDVLEHLLTTLGNSGEFSKPGVAACQAAVLALRKAQEKHHATNGKPAVNGTNGHTNGKPATEGNAKPELVGAA